MNRLIRMKYMFLVALLWLPGTAQAENQFSVGIGNPYGGFLGGKYSINLDSAKLYGGVGLLGYSSAYGSVVGYSLGFDCQIFTKHSLGLSYGTVALSSINRKEIEYLGPSLNYAYYFSSFDAKSWLIGLSAYSGTRDTPDSRFESKDGGIKLNAGYQF